MNELFVGTGVALVTPFLLNKKLILSLLSELLNLWIFLK